MTHAPSDPGLRAALCAVGGDPAVLARRLADAHTALEISGPAATAEEIRHWRIIPYEHVRAVAAATRVPRWELRPDMFDPMNAGHVRHRAEAVRRVLAKAGSLSYLAWLLDVRPQAISQWDEIPVMRVRAVAMITGIQPHVLRPDVFDPPPMPSSIMAAAQPMVGAGEAA